MLQHNIPQTRYPGVMLKHNLHRHLTENERGEDPMARNRWTRRELIQAGGAAIALPLLVPSHAIGFGAQPGANDAVRVAIIGLGGRARDIAGTCRGTPGIQVVAVCDAFYPRCGAVRQRVRRQRLGRRREMGHLRRIPRNDRKGKPRRRDGRNHHPRPRLGAFHAMAAGMDVYIEKPMSLTIAEGREMVKPARKHRVTQVGTQQRSMPMNNWASDLVKNGAIGKVKTVLAPNSSARALDPQPGQPMPEGGRRLVGRLDQPGRDAPYHRTAIRLGPLVGLRRRRRCFGVTGWGTHCYDRFSGPGHRRDRPGRGPARRAGPGDAHRQFRTRRPWARNDRRRLPRHGPGDLGPRAKVTMKYANGTAQFHLDGDAGRGWERSSSATRED